MSYEEKYISVEQALSFVKSDDVIVTGLGAAEAGLFMGQLHTIADRVRKVTAAIQRRNTPTRTRAMTGWYFRG